MFKRMLVPIDGSHTSATIVPYAAKLAKRLDCAMDLLLVESPDGPKLPHPEHHRPDTRRSGSALVAGTKTPEHIREANQRYIARHVEECEALGVAASGKVVCGEPVEEILQAALELRSDVMCMATRKLSNFAKRDTGSIAEEVLWRSKLPVMMVAA